MAFTRYRKPNIGRPAYAKKSTVPVAKVPFVVHPSTTAQQFAFWNAVEASRSNIILRSLAGTGKTYSGVGGLFRIPNKTCAFVAFGKINADELGPKVPEWAQSCTTHSLGKRAINAAFGFVKVDIRKYGRSMDFLPQEMEYPVKQLIGHIVSLCKAELNDGTDRTSLLELAAEYNVALGDDTNTVCEWVPKVLKMSRENVSSMDFDDMIWLPVVNPDVRKRIVKFDVLMVDEFQDMNPAQQDLVMLYGDIIIGIGDENQSIFGFRGADTEGMANMQRRLEATERGCIVLPLTVTQRCAPAIVQFAQQFVSEFEAQPDKWAAFMAWQELNSAATFAQQLASGHGAICRGTDCMSQYQPGDMVICRTNAPLIAIAYSCIRAMVPVVIQGRDIGQGLALWIKRLVPVDASSVQLLELGAAFVEAESAKLACLKGTAAKLEALQDRWDCIVALCEGMDTVQNVLDRIQTLFVDAQKGDASKFVWLSSVHKSKGLESDVVYVIRPDLMPHPMAKTDKEKEQELHLMYVGATRAKTVLHWH